LSIVSIMSTKNQIEDYLNDNLPAADSPPAELHEAMRYAVIGGGKRLRPILAIAACEAVGGTLETVLPAAAAIELIHSYSLIHDDLPCMDDDDLRHGQPTTHKKFGEATALLAGDALLTLAFEWAAKLKNSEIIKVIARAAGNQGMVGGQIADLSATGNTPSAEQLEFIHSHKTADLITAAVVVGGLAGEGSPAQISKLRKFGQNLGLAFQFVDDILDCTSEAQTLGKTPGKDMASDKVTAVAVYGLEGAKVLAKKYIDEAKKILADETWKSNELLSIANFILNRKY